MDLNEPATKRVKLHRTCKAMRPVDSPPESSSSNAVSQTDVKRKNAKANQTAQQMKSESSPIETHEIAVKQSTTKAEPLKLTDLNSHCLLKVMQHLALSDLCAMAEVCVILKEVALKAFPVMFSKELRLGSLAIPSIHTRTLVMVRRLLYNFGHLVRSLSVRFSLLNQICYGKLFALIFKYCSKTIQNVVIWDEPICEKYLHFVGVMFLKGNFAAEVFDSKTIYRNQRQK